MQGVQVQRLDTLCRETEAEEWRVVVQERLEDERDPGHETLHKPGTLHTFYFPPTRARYVKLAVLQSHDPYQVANLQYFYAGYIEGRGPLLLYCWIIFTPGVQTTR